MEQRIFREGSFLIPRTKDMDKWAVIAVDQYTSQPDYWQRVKETVKDSPSSLHCVYPEVYLSKGKPEQIETIHQNMKRYLDEDLFQEYENAYIYIERTVSGDRIRKGVLGCIDLEAYDYHDHTDCPIRATEKTVVERLPSRIAVRMGAPLELSHVILFCDDAQKQLIESIHPEDLPMLYDFDLMENGGHIRGWLLGGKDADAFNQRLEQYYAYKKGCSLLFAAGDGNHSIASAKEVYEQLKKEHPEIDYTERPERYMSVELENIHDPVQVFEPIHRIFYGNDSMGLLAQLKQEKEDEKGVPLNWYCNQQSGTIRIRISDTGYQTGTLQNFLDRYMENNGGELDYIHGSENLKELSVNGAIGFEVLPIENDTFFHTIERNGVYVRKTFSVGESDDKRFYLEARKIAAEEGNS